MDRTDLPLKPKFNIHDTVFILFEGTIHRVRVSEVCIILKSGPAESCWDAVQEETYAVRTGYGPHAVEISRNRDELFTSVQELTNKLTERVILH